MKFTIPRKQRGDRITADEFNAIVEELERLGKWRVAAPLDLRDTGAGFALALGAGMGLRLRWGRVTATWAEVDGNIVNLQPVASIASPTDTSEGPLDVFIYLPTDFTPIHVDLQEDWIVAYWPLTMGGVATGFLAGNSPLKYRTCNA